jgi:MFS family permease
VASYTLGTKEVKKSLKYSILDGSAYSAMLGLTQDYIVPFALALRATTVQIGLLCSIPNVGMALSQLAAPHLAERASSRKGLIVPVTLTHALMWLPILFVPYVFAGQRIWWLIGFFTLSTVFGSLGNPAWASMMADLVPAGTRGKYFGFRGGICGLAALIFSFLAVAILHLSAADIFLGFSLIFGGAMLFRLVSGYFLSRMYEPPFLNMKAQHHSLTDIARNLGSSNLGRFAIYISLMNFATYLAAPFFAVYMLRDLKFDYLTYVTVTATAALANLMFLTFWGRRADRAGNIKVLRVTSILVPLVPLLWVGGHQLYYLIPVQVLSGFAWAGFNLASANFLYDASTPQERTRCVALFNAMNGSAICLGALLGGLLAPHLPPVLGHSLLALFLISGLLRGLGAATLLRRIAEVRQVAKMTMAELMFGRLNFARNGGKNILQPLIYLLSQLDARKVASVFRWSPGRWQELVTVNRSPPS